MTKTIAVDIGHGTTTSGKGVTVGGKLYKEHTFNSAVGVELDKLSQELLCKAILSEAEITELLKN